MQYEIFKLENIHTNNLIETEQVSFRYLGMCINIYTLIHMYVRTMEMRVINFRERKERFMRGFEQRRGKMAMI